MVLRVVEVWLRAGGDALVLLPHVSYVRDGRAHPVVHDVVGLEDMLGGTLLAPVQMRQDFLPENVQLAPLLGFHRGQRCG